MLVQTAFQADPCVVQPMHGELRQRRPLLLDGFLVRHGKHDAGDKCNGEDHHRRHQPGENAGECAEEQPRAIRPHEFPNFTEKKNHEDGIMSANGTACEKFSRQSLSGIPDGTIKIPIFGMILKLFGLN